MKPTSIPYCTVKAFRACLVLLERERPAVVDKQSLVALGLSPHAAYPVLGALRFLGMIDSSGGLTEAGDQFIAGGVGERRRVVESAYAPILGAIRFPIDDRDDVDRLLVEAHGVATGVAAFCSTFFLWLAAEAGMPVASIDRHRRGRPPAHLTQLSDAARASLLEHAADLRAIDESSRHAADFAREADAVIPAPAAVTASSDAAR